jgi:hypothetical protein
VHEEVHYFIFLEEALSHGESHDTEERILDNTHARHVGLGSHNLSGHMHDLLNLSFSL